LRVSRALCPNIIKYSLQISSKRFHSNDINTSSVHVLGFSFSVILIGGWVSASSARRIAS
jgi:hypothetical protein